METKGIVFSGMVIKKYTGVLKDGAKFTKIILAISAEDQKVVGEEVFKVGDEAEILARFRVGDCVQINYVDRFNGLRTFRNVDGITPLTNAVATLEIG